MKKNGLSFLSDELSNFGGEDLYNCAMQAFELYGDEYYEFVPNAIRVFYECFVINFFGGVEYCEKKYGTPDIKKTVDEYFTNTKTTPDDKKFYREIFQGDWKRLNEWSHYLSREKYNSKNMIEEIDGFLYNMESSCEYFYEKKKGKKYKYSVDIDELKFGKKKNYEQKINSLTEKNNSLKSKNSELETKFSKTTKYAKRLEKYYEDLKTNYNNLVTNYQRTKSINESLIKEKNQLEYKTAELIQKNVQLEEESKKKKSTYIVSKTPSETSVPKISDNPLSVNILEIIKYMNGLGCYATVVTITNIFKGITNTPQILAFPNLKYCRLYNTNKNISYNDVNICIDKLIRDKKIYKDSGKYQAYKD